MFFIVVKNGYNMLFSQSSIYGQIHGQYLQINVLVNIIERSKYVPKHFGKYLITKRMPPDVFINTFYIFIYIFTCTCFSK